MQWPNPTDYQDAVQNPRLCFFDSELKAGVVATNLLGLPRVASGNFASVYEVQSGGRRWAVRCFLRQNGNQQRHYELVSQHLQGTWLPFMVNFEYQSPGIWVHAEPLPLVKMEWVEGVTLPTFLGKHLHDAKLMLSLAAQWRGLVNSLQGSRLAHGDLQHGNVLVTPHAQIKLVDYDAMYVPALHGSPCTELGHANYQHPQRAASDYDHHLDNFSGLVIYLSLRALAAEPALWKDFYTGDNLLFTSQDFKAPTRSAVFQRLQRHSDTGVQTIAAQLAQCCLGTTAHVSNFEAVIVGAAGTSLPIVPTPPMPSAPNPTQMPQWWTPTSSAPHLPTTSTQPPHTTPASSVPVSGPNILGRILGRPVSSPSPFVLTSGSIRINPKDGAEMVYIPVGHFVMGDDKISIAKPRRTFTLDAYYIYKKPVTVAQYREFCKETTRNMPAAPAWGWKEDHPIVNVNWEDANAYAKWVDATLPTEAQWEKAASWDDVKKQKRQFPWGEDFNSSRLWCSKGSIGDAGSTSPAGAFQTGASPYGALDMAGNVHEWCTDWYHEGSYETALEHNPTGPGFGKEHVVRGGSWYIYLETYFRCAYRHRRVAHNGYPDGGFRCCVSV